MVDAISASASAIPKHTRLANFGTVYIDTRGKQYELNTTDLLCGFIQKLDERNIYLSTAAERFEFLLEMYVTDVLGLPVNSAFDLIASNNVEDLYYNTHFYRTMQQYTILPIWDLYKLTWDKFIAQPYPVIEFQLRMARAYKESVERLGNPGDDEKEIMLDENHKVSIPTKHPEFKRSF